MAQLCTFANERITPCATAGQRHPLEVQLGGDHLPPTAVLGPTRIDAGTWTSV